MVIKKYNSWCYSGFYNLKKLFLKTYFVDKYFLEYMNEGLNLFKNNKKVLQFMGTPIK